MGLDSFRNLSAEDIRALAEAKKAAKREVGGKLVFQGKVSLDAGKLRRGTVQVDGSHVTFTVKSSVLRIALADITRVEVVPAGPLSSRLLLWGKAISGIGIYRGPTDEVKALRSALGF